MYDEAADEDDMAPEMEENLDRLVRKGLVYSKKWDRLSKLKLADGRKGWEKHVVGALCQVSLSSSFLIQGWAVLISFWGRVSEELL